MAGFSGKINFPGKIKVIQIALITSYPAMIYWASSEHINVLYLLAIINLTTGIFVRPLLSLNLTISSIYILFIGLALGCYLVGYSFYLATIVPLLFPVIIGIAFAHSLLPGNIPIVTAIGEHARGPLSHEMRAYTKRITQAWVIILSVLVISSLMSILATSTKSWHLQQYPKPIVGRIFFYRGVLF